MLFDGVLKLPEMNDYTHKSDIELYRVRQFILDINDYIDCPIITFYISALVIMEKTYPFGFEACLSA